VTGPRGYHRCRLDWPGTSTGCATDATADRESPGGSGLAWVGSRPEGRTARGRHGQCDARRATHGRREGRTGRGTYGPMHVRPEGKPQAFARRGVAEPARRSPDLRAMLVLEAESSVMALFFHRQSDAHRRAERVGESVLRRGDEIGPANAMAAPRRLVAQRPEACPLAVRASGRTALCPYVPLPVRPSPPASIGPCLPLAARSPSTSP
jgi:hypothetical protein